MAPALSTAMTLQLSIPEEAQRVLAAHPRAKGRKQTLAAAAFGKRLIHRRGEAGSTPMTKDTCSASAPTHCLLFTQQLVRHEPVVFVGEMSGLEGKIICWSWFFQMQTSISCFSGMPATGQLVEGQFAPSALRVP